MKRFFIILCICFICGVPSYGQGSEKPNIIIIFTDDQGYADLGSYGAIGFTTPNLDSMAKEGVRFTNFYVASGVCSPSRAALLTGSYPVRVGIPDVLRPISPTGLNPNEITIAELLKDQGYATACVGKWHLGDHPKMMPNNQGFDEYFGIPYSNDMWPWWDDYKKERHTELYPDLPLYLNDKVIELNPDQNKITTRYTDYAIQFIEKNKNKPFFLYLAHTMPHLPLGVSEKFEGKTQYGRYGDVMEEIDWSVGEILETLKRNNLDDKTLVIFTSDNGPNLQYGKHAGQAFPLREGKSTTFEGGMRVPCIMRWPDKIPPGFVNHEMVTAMDLLPTIARLAGTQEPKDRVIDGQDIWPQISGKSKKTSKRVLFYYQQMKLQAVRSGPWKLHFPHKYNHQSGDPGIDGRAAGKIVSSIDLSLFNLDEDIGEKINLAEKHPDIVKKLTDLADAHIKDLAENSRAPLEISDINWRRYKDKLSKGKYFTDWWLIGPFDNTNREGMERIYPPEDEFNIDKSYLGRNNKNISWHEYDGKNIEYISLSKMFKPSDIGVVYARREFNLKKSGILNIGLGTNDGVKMWVNGKLVYKNIVSRTAIPNQDMISLPFVKGKNDVLLKIDQLGGGWGFYFSIIEGQELLEYKK